MSIYLLIANKKYVELTRLIKEKPELIDPLQYPSPLQQAINERDIQAFEIIMQGMHENNLITAKNEKSVLYHLLNCLFTNTEFEANFLKKIPKEIEFYDKWMNEILDSYLHKIGYGYRRKSHVIESASQAISWLLAEINLDFKSCLLRLVAVPNKEKYVIEYLTILINHYKRKNTDNPDGIFEVTSEQLLKSSPLYKSYAAENFEVTKFLLKCNLDILTETRGITEVHLMLNAFYGKNQEEIICLAFQKFGGIERFKIHHPSLLYNALHQWNDGAARLLLKLGFKLEWTIPGSEGTYLSLCIKGCLDYTHSKKRKQIIQFLKEHINIEDPKLWESVNLAEEAGNQNWEVCEILLKLNRDPYECDRFGDIAIDKITSLLPYVSRSDDHVYERMLHIESTLKEKMRLTTPSKNLARQVFEQAKTDPHPKVKEESDNRDNYYRNLYSKINDAARELREHHIGFKVSQKKVLSPSKEYSARNYSPFDEQDLKAGQDRTIIRELCKLFSKEQMSYPNYTFDEMTLVLEKLLTYPKFKQFFLDAEEFWNKPIDDMVALQWFYQTNQLKATAFELDQFSLDFWRYNGKLFFMDDIMYLINSLKRGICKELMSGLCYQTVSQHNAMLWSLTQRHCLMYFNKRIARKPLEKTFEFAGIMLRFRNWTQAKNYKFIVHTTSGEPEALAKTLESDAEFIRTTAFFSCSIIDKDVPPAKMEHQGKTIFTFSLILDLQDDAVIKAFHTDAWSPMLTRFKQKEEVKIVSEKYFADLKAMDEEYNLLTMLTRAKTRNLPSDLSKQSSFKNPTSLSCLDSEMILNSLTKNKKYKIPYVGFFGHVPGLSPFSTLKATYKDSTQSRFNEIIVAGKPKNKVIGILVDEDLLNEFILNVRGLNPDKMQNVRKSLELLANSKYPLILIKTAENGFYNKRTLFQKYEEHYKEIQQCLGESEQDFLKHQRLSSSKFGRKECDLTKPFDDKLYSVLNKVEDLKKKLTDIQRQINPGSALAPASRSTLAPR